MITDEQIRNAVSWYCGHYGIKPVSRSSFETWVIGHFHSYPKAAREIVERMKEMGLVNVKQGMVEVQK